VRRRSAALIAPKTAPVETWTPRPDLIAQLATAPGEAALAVIRVSGPGARELLECVFRPRGRAPQLVGTTRVGEVVDPASGEALDEAVAVWYEEGRSYTGEEMAEISCHGGHAIVRDVLSLLCREGARPAGPGEFTKRAYLNGRLDLAQAEAVCDLIRSRSEAAARASLRQLKGGLSERIKPIRDRLVELAAEVEVTLDFPDEDPASLTSEELGERCDPLLNALYRLLAEAPIGRTVRDGVTVALIGRPNTGKSSLLNALLSRDRAIVTAMPGTTRDTLEEWTELGGIPVRLVDTAGLRAPDTEVETLGIERADRALAECDIAVAVFDGSEPATDDDDLVLDRMRAKGGSWLACVNKSDLAERLVLPDLAAAERGYCGTVHTCALSSEGTRPLAVALEGVLRSDDVDPAEVVLTSERHAECVRRAATAAERAVGAAARGLPVDLAVLDVREAAECLDELLGGATTEDMIEVIFSRFCLGK